MLLPTLSLLLSAAAALTSCIAIASPASSSVSPVVARRGSNRHTLEARKKQHPAKVSFVLVGDSTTNNGTTLNSGGWSRGFCGALDEGTFCSNRASNGKTTGTIVTAGFWDLALSDIKKEVHRGQQVYVTLQFGHNDMKIAPPSSMAANLTSFVSTIRSLGAYPILLTPLSRRTFANATSANSCPAAINGGDGVSFVLNDTLQPWADATEQVGKDTKTPVLPLHAVSMAYHEKIGSRAGVLFNRAPTDFTHLNLSGQLFFGRLVADLMQTFGLNYPGYPSIISPFTIDPPLSQAIYTGSQYVFTPVYPDNSTTPCCFAT